ncbi:phosphotransferase family protein [Paenibacillus silvisoli]|uniref:phosphotransferase family protein n=1 Tax=Paenibacillus silvisoli TaxID=3110539 RepID=UPI002803B1D6|nr:phosphotransferase [Paenibacillus silvisoli]
MEDIVLPDGTLDDRRLWRRDILYTGMNGKCVERVYVTPEESVIFKPLTNESQLGLEGWVYEHILRGMSFPPIYPRLLAASGSDAGERSWQLFEDLGPLEHRFEEDAALELIEHVAWWHGLSVDGLKGQTLLGPKPFIEELAAQAFERREELAEALAERFDDPKSLVERLEALCRSESATLNWSRNALSHGDLHLGNYARVQGVLKVLDWEHAHVNSRYWDLYHAIDCSHPDFPKRMSAPVRERLLDRYLAASGSSMTELEKQSFKQGYYLFAAVFSLWMLLLIAGDLKRLNGADGKWTTAQLKAQLEETLDSLSQCVDALIG